MSPLQGVTARLLRQLGEAGALAPAGAGPVCRQSREPVAGLWEPGFDRRMRETSPASGPEVERWERQLLARAPSAGMTHLWEEGKLR